MNNSHLSHITHWVFDLDETLYDATENLAALWRKGFRDYLRSLGAQGTEEEIHALYMAAKKSHGDARLWAMEHWPTFDPHACDEMIMSQIALLQRIPPVTPSNIERVANLPGEKIIFTNAGCRHTEIVMEHIGITGMFSHISTFTSRGNTAKPSKNVYQNLQKELGISGEKIAFFEDSEMNLEPARELGWTTVLIKPDISPEKVAPYTQHHYHSLNHWLDALYGETSLSSSSERKAG